MADEAVEAARVGDQVNHSYALLGVLAGVLIGAAFAVAVVGTGGAALAVGAAICTGMSIGGSVGQLVGKHKSGPDCGPIAKGVQTVYVENMEAAVVTSPVSCNGPPIGSPHPTSQIAQGSSNVFIGKFPAARKGDKTTCGAKIGYGAATVWIGGKKTTYLEISPEVPTWVDYGLLALGILGGYGALWRLGFRGLPLLARLGGGLIGGGLGSYGGNKIADWMGLDEDSWARDGLVVGSSIAGGALGTWGGGQASNSLVKARAQTALNNHIADMKQTLGSNGDYPATSIGAYDYKTGKVVAGSSGDIPSKISPQMQAAADKLGGVNTKPIGQNNTVGRCAEFKTANDLTNQGSNLDNIKFTDAIRPRTSKLIPRCSNCQNMFGK